MVVPLCVQMNRVGIGYADHHLRGESRHHCGRSARCGHCGHGHNSADQCDPLGVAPRTSSRHGMTLARQFFLLQALIVLSVLVAVGAISIAQAARTFERQELATGAQRGGEPRGEPALCASGSAPPSRPRVRPGVGRRVGAHRVGLLGSVPDRHRPHRAGLLDLQPGGSPSDARQRPGRGASWTGTQQQGGRRVVVAQVPVYDLSGEVVGVASVGRDVPSVWTRLGEVAPNLLVYLGVASVLGLGGSLLLAGSSARPSAWNPPRSSAWSSTARHWCTA